MTDEQLAGAKAEEARLWKLVEIAKKEHERAIDVWFAASEPIRREEARIKLRAELIAEMAAEKGGGPCT